MSTQTAVSRVYNFSAGPAVLPVSVLQQIQEDLISLPGVGSSVMEISHRSPEFVEIMDDARNRLADLLQIPETHEVLFVQGGARLQNAMIPMNLLTDPSQTADYIVTGSWGQNSSKEVPRFGKLHHRLERRGYGVLPTSLNWARSNSRRTQPTFTTRPTRPFTVCNSSSPRPTAKSRLSAIVLPIS